MINDDERLFLLHKYLDCNQQALNELFTEVHPEQRKNGERMFNFNDFNFHFLVNSLDKEGIVSECIWDIYSKRIKPLSLIDEASDFKMLQSLLRFFRENFKSEPDNEESEKNKKQQERDFLSFVKTKLSENNNSHEFLLAVTQMNTNNTFMSFKLFFQDKVKTSEDFENFKKILKFFKTSFRIPEDFETYKNFENFLYTSLKKDIKNSYRNTLISLGIIQKTTLKILPQLGGEVDNATTPIEKTTLKIPPKPPELLPEEILAIRLEAQKLLDLFVKWLEKKYPAINKHYNSISEMLMENSMNYGLTSLPIEIISFLQSTEHYEDLTKKLKSSSKDENICVNTVSSYTRRLRTHWKTFCTTTTEASEWFNLSKSLLQKRINETQYADLKSGGDIS